MARWEVGDTAPDIKMLLEICEIFDVSADYMIHNDDESDEDNILMIKRLLTGALCNIYKI